ncbi:hypothetical protein FPSE_01791 [Fusarium pseudograminearum CS3096]|uniref:Uncharacterized protein n=1 Tax=Fusarium pseudograminearum (strain CS3096) TaxID=1028729 RepID=K3VUQ6_FUSPC|nr:hypothetical protein FPSE_01791 [Fusarium pseudograminearum CS3096]EKJ78003.1 hypothetical protein FPSE_01791 [Fusarium pseudograminearum CS3096]
MPMVQVPTYLPRQDWLRMLSSFPFVHFSTSLGS